MRPTLRAFLASVVGILAFNLATPALAGQARPLERQPAPADEPNQRVVEPEFPPTYGALDASREAEERFGTQRREAIERQVEMNEDMVWYSGVPDYDRQPPGLGTIYAYGGAAYVYPGRRAVRRRFSATSPTYRYYFPYHGSWSIFVPWPLVPGDVYGYPYLDRVEQPLGHKTIWTGPNGYISRPVYESDLSRPGPDRFGSDETSSPRPREAHRAEAIPAPPPERGPREF